VSAAAPVLGARSSARTAQTGPVGSPPLAPRLAACYKIAMSLAMGYMLVMMV
jgi:hypothetical protein